MARSVEGHIAASVALEHLDTLFSKFFRRSNHIRTVGVSAKSDDWTVLEQKQYVANSALFAQVDQPLLQAQSGGVINCSELDDGDHVSHLYGGEFYALMAIPYTLLDASSMASAKVGWA